MLIPSLTLLSPLVLSLVRSKVITVPNSPSDQPSQIDYSYGDSGVDAPKVRPIDSKSYDWWYFDVASSDPSDLSSVSVVFFTSTTGGFDILGPSVNFTNPSVNLIQLTLSFPNGTQWESFLNESEVTFITHGDGITGHYRDNSAFFNTAPDLSSATVKVHAPHVGFDGLLHLRSRAPPHAPCAAASPDADLKLLPHIGWINAIPDSDAYASMTLYGETVTIENGEGYHDKNWGDAPFSQQFASWYWGHARLGGYSLVFFDTLDLKGTEKASNYVAKDGKIVVAQCDGVKVRPWGNNVTYPAVLTDPAPLGFYLSMDTPDGTINATLTVQQTILGDYPSPYYRWSGSIKGSIGGGEEYEGVAFFEQFVWAQ